MGQTTVQVSMTFAETKGLQSGCPVQYPAGLCGNGDFLPYGHANEMIVFGTGCGGTCDVRTVTVADGSIVMDEQFSDPQSPGTSHPNPANPFSGTLTDVVVSGTGIFAGASGNLSGEVKHAGAHSQIKLSGSITLAN
jgi:hypothetical protein